MASYSYNQRSATGANSFQEFTAMASRRPPAINNLYWVRFRTVPNCMPQATFNDYFTGNNSVEVGPATDQARLLTYYANEVTIPSRQITTGDAKTVGSLYRYPTGTTFSEISINFTLPRQLETRMFFERWMNYISADSDNRAAWYHDSVCPFVDIIKYERGGIQPSAAQVAKSADPRVASLIKWNQSTGAWVLQNVFPFNISNMSLTNSAAGTMSMEVSFYYERYRFYVPTDTGVPAGGPPPSGSLAQGSSLQVNPVGNPPIANAAATATSVATSNGSGQQTTTPAATN